MAQTIDFRSFAFDRTADDLGKTVFFQCLMRTPPSIRLTYRASAKPLPCSARRLSRGAGSSHSPCSSKSRLIVS